MTTHTDRWLGPLTGGGRRRVVLTGGIIRPDAGDGESTDALAFDGDRIVVAGAAARAELIGGEHGGTAGYARLELAGRCVVQDFTDAHTNLFHLGLGLITPRFGAARSAAEVLEMTREAVAARPAGRALVGEGWDDSRWPAGDTLSTADLDRVSTTTPIVLRRVCGHMAVANRAALAALHAHAEAGIAARDIDDASGVLLGTASRKARRALPPAAEERAAAIEHALREAAAHGVTAVHDIGNRPSLELLTACRDQHRLTTRVLFHMNGTESLDEIEAAEQEHGDGEWLVFGGIKLYLDGSIGARTAALREPYAGTSGERGELHLGADELESSVALIHQRGRQAVLHAIGDRAIEQALAALAPLGADQVRGRGHRIEHLELVPPDLLDRMADSGAIASMQPNFVWQWQGDGGLYEQRLGRARWRWMNRFRSIVQRGIPLVFGSDCMPLGPLGGITGAVEHPQQIERLSVCEALHACTRAAAAIAPHGIASGRLAPGDPADFVILDRDPLASGRPAEVRVLATVVGGRLVHPSPASGAT